MPEPCKNPDPALESAAPDRTKHADWPEPVRWALSAAIVALIVLVMVAPKARLSRWYIYPGGNSNFAEALAWLDGRLDSGHVFLLFFMLAGLIAGCVIAWRMISEKL